MAQFREYRKKSELLQGVEKPYNKATMIPSIKATMKIEYKDGTEAIRYHDTDVITFGPETITLNSGGFRTKTTKERINYYLPFDVGRVFQEKGIWYVSAKGNFSERTLFYDGITFNSAGELLSPPQKLDQKRIDKVKKKIAKFVKLVDKGIPLPDNGDCWYCLGMDPEGKQLDHIEDHVKEGYLHGALIFNALKEKGYSNPGLIMHMKLTDHVKRALRIYLMKRLLPDLCTS